MADSSPLLSPPRLQYKHVVPAHHDLTLDDAIERCIGSFSWAQFLQALVVSAAWLFDAQQTFISVFTDSNPSWHCTRSNASLSSCNSAVRTHCDLPSSAWDWDEPARTSTVSEWNLACSGSVLAGLPASSFFAGCLAGGLVLATLADSLGRKNMLILSCLVMSLAGVATVFSPNIWVYSALRFVAGFARATIGTCALVLATEVVGKRWRSEVGVMGFFCFTIGFLSLPAMAFLKRGSSWRELYLITSIPTYCYCLLVYFVIHESPRWLWVKGRKEEAIRTLRTISSSSSSITSFTFSGVSIQEAEAWNVDLYSAIKILLEKRWAFRRLTTVMLLGFGIGLVYYGMPLGVGNLGFNLYLSVTLNALSELPSSLITVFVMSKLNRRSTLLWFTMASGVSSMICAVDMVGKETKMVMEMVSFFSACTAFNVLLIYTLELFPTSVRNSALSMTRQAVVLGGVVCPVLVSADRKLHGSVSYGVFGLAIGLSGIFATFLPETRGGTLCDTMDEQEKASASASVASASVGENGV